MTMHNPFANTQIASRYQAWYQTAGKRADRQEKILLKRLLDGFPAARSILEVGSGTGHFTRWFGEQGLQAVGVDLSRAMLEETRSLRSPACLQGDALQLPFASRSFDLVALVTTLEFLPDPTLALVEAMRVAREGLILGALNARSRLGRQYKREGGQIWEFAHLFTPKELRQMLGKAAAGRVNITWRTTIWLVDAGALPLPWGGFIGMAAHLQ